MPLIGLLTTLPTVYDAALLSYPWLVLLPLVAVWSYLLDGIFIGATRTQAMQYDKRQQHARYGHFADSHVQLPGRSELTDSGLETGVTR